MDQGIFIALLNPAISLVLAGAFLLLWLVLRTRPYLLMLAAGYLASAAGFLLQRFELPIGFNGTKLASCVSFAVAAALLATSISLRYDRKVPFGGLGVLIGGGIAAFCWFLFVVPDLTWRIFAMNFALGGVGVLVTLEVRAVPDKRPVDMLIYGASALVAANFFVRTIVVVAMHGSFDSYAGFYTSLYWSSLLLSHALLSLGLALCLAGAAASDVLRNLQLESRTDPLSGLFNRRGLEDKARALCLRQAKGGAGFSLVMADLDHFKSVNDKHGHPVGDAVIAAFSRLLVKIAGPGAVVARTGGEEFAIVLSGKDLARARSFAEAIRTALGNGLGGQAAAAGPITCSFGVTERNAAEGLDNVLARADGALMYAKRTGRDRVRTVYLRPEITPSRMAAA